MVVALSFNTAKSDVISALQASQTPYATTVDGSNAQYSSDVEIANAILTADGILATIIANTLQHPYQTTFVQTSSPLASGASLPARNGMILKVQGLDSPTDLTFIPGNVDIGLDTIDFSTNGTSATYGLVTGLRVRFTTTGALPARLAVGVDYWLNLVGGISAVGICTSPFTASAAIFIDLTDIGSGTGTMVMQYEDATQALSKDQVLVVNDYPTLYGSTNPAVSRFWFIEGDVLYSTSAFSKVIYTDYTLTTSPQCPEPYLAGVVAGAIALLAKDGSDAGLASYYQGIFNQYQQMTAQGAMVLPAISSYQVAA